MVTKKDQISRATLTSKGQIVIGSKLRKKLDLKPQQRFSERIEEGRMILERLETPIELKGSLREMAEGKMTDELIKEVKEGWK